MIRIIPLLWVILLLLPRPADALTDAENAAVRKAEAALNSITTMKARFVQVNADGASFEGDLYVSRPGRMRLVYDPPTPMLMIADGVFLIYVDKEMEDVSHIDLDETLAGLLLKKNLSFGDPDVKLMNVRLGDEVVEITATRANDAAAGSLTFVFTEKPFAFHQWRVVDAQNKEVRVTLMNPEFGTKMDAALFRYDVRRQRQGGE